MIFSNPLPRRTAVALVLAFAFAALWPYLGVLKASLSDSDKSLSPAAIVKGMGAQREAMKQAKQLAAIAKDASRMDPHGLALDADGNVWVAAKEALFILKDGQFNAVTDFPGMEAKGVFTDAADQLYVGAKDGLYERAGNEWVKVFDGEEVRSGVVTPDGQLVISVKKSGLYTRNAAGDWIPLQAGYAPSASETKMVAY